MRGVAPALVVILAGLVLALGSAVALAAEPGVRGGHAVGPSRGGEAVPLGRRALVGGGGLVDSRKPLPPRFGLGGISERPSGNEPGFLVYR
jgi:hypothetical protein